MKSKVHEVITSLSYVKHKKYKYVLTSDFKIKLNRGWRGKYRLKANGKVRAVLNDDILTILSGYAWDGCTMAPDFAETMIASLLHDLLFQFGALDLWTFSESNEIFFIQLKQEKFKLALVYYKAVCAFGRFFYGKSVVYKEPLIEGPNS